MILQLLKFIGIGLIFVLLIPSLVILVFGLLLYGGDSFLNDHTKPLEDRLEIAAKQMGIQLDTKSIKISAIMAYAGKILIIAGSISTATLLGGLAVGALDNVFLTAGYLFILLFMFIVLIAILFNFAMGVEEVKKLIEPALKETLNDYRGDSDEDAISMAWNGIMAYYNCCGVNGKSDFQDLENWDFKKTDVIDSVFETPRICCKEKSKNITCALKGKVNDANNFGSIGCLEKIAALVNDYKVFFVLFALFEVQLFILIACMSLVLASAIARKSARMVTC